MKQPSDLSEMKREVSHAQFARLERRAKRVPIVAIMGEFSAGKSTLVNFLIGQGILPTKVTATEFPPIWISFGSRKAYGINHSGRRFDIEDGDWTTVDMSRTRVVRVFVEAEILKHCDLIDMPGISDPNLARESWIGAVHYAHMVIWCTHATQAWRQTEQSLWSSLPKRLRSKSFLAATRADMLTTPEDQQKVLRRLRRETENLFGDVILMSTAAAQASGDEYGDAAENHWLRDFSGVFETCRKRVVEERKALLQRYAVPVGDAAPRPATEDLNEIDTSPRVIPRRVKAVHASVARPDKSEAVEKIRQLRGIYDGEELDSEPEREAVSETVKNIENWKSKSQDLDVPAQSQDTSSADIEPDRNVLRSLWSDDFDADADYFGVGADDLDADVDDLDVDEDDFYTDIDDLSDEEEIDLSKVTSIAALRREPEASSISEPADDSTLRDAFLSAGIETRQPERDLGAEPEILKPQDAELSPDQVQWRSACEQVGVDLSQDLLAQAFDLFLAERSQQQSSVSNN